MVRDSHCHLLAAFRGDTLDEMVQAIELNETVNSRGFFNLMSTNHIDFNYVDYLSQKTPAVFPYFGVHPWYSHLFSDGEVDKETHYRQVLSPEPPAELLENLPEPIDINKHLEHIKERIAHAGVGEIGLDKVFRVPLNGFYGNVDIANDGEVKLSPCRVSLDHQTMILNKQLNLANESKVPVSLHCVKAHGPLYEAVTRYDNIHSIVLHSFSGLVDQAKLWVKTYRKKNKLYFSFSNYINGVDEKSGVLQDLVHQLDTEQILVETDFGIDSQLQNIAAYLTHLDEITSKLKVDRSQLEKNELNMMDI